MLSLLQLPLISLAKQLPLDLIGDWKNRCCLICYYKVICIFPESLRFCGNRPGDAESHFNNNDHHNNSGSVLISRQQTHWRQPSICWLHGWTANRNVRPELATRYRHNYYATYRNAFTPVRSNFTRDHVTSILAIGEMGVTISVLLLRKSILISENRCHFARLPRRLPEQGRAADDTLMARRPLFFDREFAGSRRSVGATLHKFPVYTGIRTSTGRFPPDISPQQH